MASQQLINASVRPESVISAKIDKQWHPTLVSPAFPSYTSGHSTISAAAAEVLTGLFADNQAIFDEAVNVETIQDLLKS